jgi:hypothetical protein
MKYVKAILTTVIGIGAALVTALGTGNEDFSSISAQAWVLAILTVLGSGALVWWTENTKAAPVIKTVIAGLSAGLGSLVLALDADGTLGTVTQAEWITAFVAAVTATGLVYQAKDPALPDPTTVPG